MSEKSTFRPVVVFDDFAGVGDDPVGVGVEFGHHALDPADAGRHVALVAVQHLALFPDAGGDQRQPGLVDVRLALFDDGDARARQPRGQTVGRREAGGTAADDDDAGRRVHGTCRLRHQQAAACRQPGQPQAGCLQQSAARGIGQLVAVVAGRGTRFVLHGSSWLVLDRAVSTGTTRIGRGSTATGAAFPGNARGLRLRSRLLLCRVHFRQH
jgi:hypothetical protein